MTLPLLVASCPTRHGSGGLGQHLAKVGQDSLSEGFGFKPYCQGGHDEAVVIDGDWERNWFRWPPFRWRPALRVWWRHERFDRQVAARLQPADTVLAFMGCAERTFRRARELGVRKLVLEMPNSHPFNVQRQHQASLRHHPLEPSWMGDLFAAKAHREMAMADEIRANSEYTRETTISEGIDEAKIVRRHLGCHPRFSKVVRRPHPENLHVAVFIGSLSPFKGVPLLVEAFRQTPGATLRLLLIGGWASRGMRLWLEDARRRDPRISWTSGDPVPHLETASIAFHPTWEDGWAYAPVEALTAGLPVVVSDQTGMKEMLAGTPDSILPAGDSRAWETRLARWASAVTS